MPPNLLTNFEIQKYYQNEPKFSGVYSRNSLPKINDGAICNKYEYKSISIQRVTFHLNGNNGSTSYNATFFDSFGVLHAPLEIKKSP